MAEAKKAERSDRALLLSNEIFDAVDEDASGSMEFDEFAQWAQMDGRPIEWLEEYCEPLLTYMDRIELTNASLHAEAAANGFSAVICPSLHLSVPRCISLHPLCTCCIYVSILLSHCLYLFAARLPVI